jgi:hypothetical protein
MKRRLYNILQAALIVGLSISMLKVKCALDSEGTILSSADFRFTAANLSGWKEDAGTYQSFDVPGLYNLINGGAPAYETGGLIEGIEQTVSKGSGNSAVLKTYDFGSGQKATEMYNTLKTDFASKFTFGSFSEADALGSTLLGGVKAIAHFDRFVFELGLTGYDDVNVAKSDAAIFINSYRNKVEE